MMNTLVSFNGVLAVQTLKNNIMASILLASTTIMLSSFIAALMTHSSNQSSGFIFGDDKSPLEFSIKYFSILLCFLLSFLFNVQSIRYYSHASILINVPLEKMTTNSTTHITLNYVGRAQGKLFSVIGSKEHFISHFHCFCGFLVLVMRMMKNMMTKKKLYEENLGMSLW
ncbi:hypothetical protein MKW94_016884 [Papaver nudicaule]|uniref:Uncharacterized protein n=1 Tax=Papaver nudicaule TaxID=74823 RepID=A0AA41W2V8_PAPNU|nr:hypothetical protein [Papaver nudicaule]